MGKGDTPRPMNKGKYDEGYERVFGKRAPKVWENPPRFGEGDRPVGGPNTGGDEGAGGHHDPETQRAVGNAGTSTLCPNCGRTIFPANCGVGFVHEHERGCNWTGALR